MYMCIWEGAVHKQQLPHVKNYVNNTVFYDTSLLNFPLFFLESYSEGERHNTEAEGK